MGDHVKQYLTFQHSKTVCLYLERKSNAYIKIFAANALPQSYLLPRRWDNNDCKLDLWEL